MPLAVQGNWDELALLLLPLAGLAYWRWRSSRRARGSDTRRAPPQE